MPLKTLIILIASYTTQCLRLDKIYSLSRNHTTDMSRGKRTDTTWRDRCMIALRARTVSWTFSH